MSSVNNVMVSISPSSSHATGSVSSHVRASVKRAEGAADSVKVHKGGHEVADSAEGRDIHAMKGDSHASLKESRAGLVKTLKDCGKNISSESAKADVEGSAQEFLSETKEKIKNLSSKNENDPEIEKLKSSVREVSQKLETYQKSFREMTSADEGADLRTVASASEVSSEEQKTLETLKTEFSEHMAEGVESFEQAHSQILSSLSKKYHVLSSEVSSREAAVKELEEKIKATTPDEKVKLETQLQKVKAELSDLNVQQKKIQTQVVRAQELAEKGLALQTKRELGLNLIEESPGVAATREVSESSEAPLLGSASAREETSSRPVTRGVRNSRSSERSSSSATTSEEVRSPMIGTASVETPNDSESDLSIIHTATVDSVMVSTQTVSQQVRDDAQRSSRMIEELIELAKNGSSEAVKMALILLAHKSGINTTAMATTVLKAMQASDQISESNVERMGSTNFSGANGQASFAQLNQEINLQSQKKQMFSNMLRTIMDFQEVTTSMTNNVLQGYERIQQQVTRG